MQSSERHFYEIIPDGVPCKLYFDLEYKLAPNEGCDAEALVASFKSLVSGELEQAYGVSVDPEMILDLRSASAGKFSSHLIWDLPGVAFADNVQAGNFVLSMLSRFRACISDGQDPRSAAMKRLLVKNEQGETEFFVDQSVYTRNRALRIYLSSKFGSRAAFHPADHPSPGLVAPSRALFERSLVTHHVSAPARLLTATGPCSSSSSAPFVDFPSADGAAPSDLDAFVLSIATENGGPSATIRSRQLSPDRGTLRFNMAGNRFCHNVRRQHKSNNVYYDVKLSHGVVFQRCTDTDCRGYRSSPRLVPVELLPDPSKAGAAEPQA